MIPIKIHKNKSTKTAVEPGSATATIVKTGPGVFTKAVMEWMVATNANSEVSTSATKNADENTGDATDNEAPTSPAAGAAAESGVETAITTVLVLPPSYFYPVRNDVKGDLIGDGNEHGVHERAGRFFAKESLAAHLWGKSWQDRELP